MIYSTEHFTPIPLPLKSEKFNALELQTSLLCPFFFSSISVCKITFGILTLLWNKHNFQTRLVTQVFTTG